MVETLVTRPFGELQNYGAFGVVIAVNVFMFHGVSCKMATPVSEVCHSSIDDNSFWCLLEFTY